MGKDNAGVESQPIQTLRTDWAPLPHKVSDVFLSFDLDVDRTVVRSVLSMERNLESSERGEIRLDAVELEILSVSFDGEELSEGPRGWSHDGAVLRVHRDPDGAFEIRTECAIRPKENTALEGLYASGSMLVTQCEAEGFRRISPFPDRPDATARFQVELTADPDRFPVLLSNGNPAGESVGTDGRRTAVWIDPHPKPCYLFALAAGDLVETKDSFTTASGRPVRLGIWTEKGDEGRTGHAMASLKKAMRWDEERFGLEYDLDVFNIVAAAHFNMGAMENKGLNVFNSKYVLADEETGTDADFLGIESVIAHEYFHNWTGNRVTCRDWFQLTLKEGLTVYRDQEFSAEMNSEAAQRIDDVRALRAGQFPEDDGPMAHPVRPEAYLEISNFYTATVYQKGAEVIRMIARVLGRNGFRKGMDLYFQRHDGDAATCEDFVSAMQDATGTDLSALFKWYSKAGTPTLKARWERDGDGQFALTLSQSEPGRPAAEASDPVLVPVAIGFVGPDGSAVPAAGDGLLLLSEREKTFVFDKIPEGSVPSLLRGFSAPVRLEAPQLDDGALAHLSRFDADGFSRWEAGFQLKSRIVERLVADAGAGRELVLDPRLAESLRAALELAATDPVLASETLGLPTAGHLAERMDKVDPAALFAGRDFARDGAASALRPELEAAWERMSRETAKPFSLDPAEIGRRTLKCAVLGLLRRARGDEGSWELVEEAFFSSRTMTESIAALALAAEHPDPRRSVVLEAFESKWRGNALVMDKWFAVQAGADRDGSLEDAKRLMERDDFSMTNPNRFRSVAGAFSGCLRRMHAADGSGHRFVADLVLALDPLNPQVASRLAQGLSRWRRFSSPWGESLRTQMERIAAAPGLSKDVFEVASKSLAP